MTYVRGKYGAGLVLALLMVAPAVADDVSGAERLLCAPSRVSHCVDNQGCEYGAPKSINVPDFIKIDLSGQMLEATQADGEERKSPIDHMTHEAGYIYLQGVEYGRAFTMVIAKSTGELAFTIVTHGKAATMFGVCTSQDR
jgi:hypothetical protein